MEIKDSKIKFKTEIDSVDNIYYEAEGTINLLDELLNARDELFENKLRDGLKSHYRLLKAVKGDLPHQS